MFSQTLSVLLNSMVVTLDLISPSGIVIVTCRPLLQANSSLIVQHNVSRFVSEACITVYNNILYSDLILLLLNNQYWVSLVTVVQ